MATTVADLNRIVTAEERSGVKVFVGFCMRYNNLFARACQIVRSGLIGRPRLMSFQDYFSLGRGYFRGRNRFARFSGGLLVEKACHSFDLMSWLLGSRPVRTSCFGRLSVFTAKEGAGKSCAGCALTADCPDHAPPRGGEDPLCVYTSEKDVDDTNALLLDYESGALASYVECFYSPTVDRRFSLVGDRGELLGSEERGLLEWRRLGDTAWTREEVAYNPGGHKGADTNMVSAAIAYFRGEADPEARVDSDSGRLSVLTALAAQRSAKEGRTVTLSEVLTDSES
jgi:predicted dehydrogenase